MSYLFITIKPTAADETEHDVYDTKFYNLFKHTLNWCMSHRKIVLAVTAACFLGAVSLMGLVKQQFFANSTRPELIVQLELPEGAAINNTDEVANQVAEKLNDNPLISYYTYHVGEGAPRFVLSFEPTFSKTNFAEFIIVANDYKARDKLNVSLSRLVNDEFPSVHVHTKILPNGPSADYPVMLRVNGYDQDKVLEIAEKVRIAMEANPGAKNVNLNWNEKSKIIHLAVDQDKARNLGITSQTLSNALQAQLSGTPFAEFREYDKTVNMVFRFDSQDRYDPSRIKNLNIQASNGQYIPLDQIAKISFDTEHGLIYRRDLKPMVWVQAEITPGTTGDGIAQQVYESLADVRANLPLGYSIDYDGTKSDSLKATTYINATIPAMLISIMILLITQLQSIPKLILTLLTAPLGLIGVSIGLLVTNSAMGFVVTLGILALAGIIMRNTVVLMDQISQQLEAGESLWDAIVNATIIRFRPICLTAAAAILGMVPL
ncbi:MAG: acriflavin resistance protein, partial [Firmicutes bacterium]|nr:acriflavin resistance protein [Bacillota bacterium]